MTGAGRTTGPNGGAHAPGSIGEEAARLAEAVASWARGETGGRTSAAVGQMATGDPVCCICPVCTVITVLRGDRPDVTARLTEAVTGLVSAGQALLETITAAAAETRDSPGADSQQTPADSGRAQTIPLD